MIVCVFLRHQNKSDDPVILKSGFPTMKENEFYNSTNSPWLFFNNSVLKTTPILILSLNSVLAAYVGTKVPSWSTIECIKEWNMNFKGLKEQ